MTKQHAQIAVVIIGRNEGERLERCLEALVGLEHCVYVDSDSTDGSVATARRLGFEVIELDPAPRLTAARARNAGLHHVLSAWPEAEFVQMLDGDCVIDPAWLEQGIAALSQDPGLALVFGRLRERFPQQSIYNALCDDEWNVPVGEVQVAPGNVLCRVAALATIGGYRENMIAGEDPDMALRLRAEGWRLARIVPNMALHDAAIHSFSQWWRRAKRSGHAFAELARLHPQTRKPNWRRQCHSIVVWAGVIPAATLLGFAGQAVAGRASLALAFLLLLAWPLKMGQMAARKRRSGLDSRTALASGVLVMVGKFAELQGLFGYYRNRVLKRQSQLIEHKQVPHV